MAFFASSNNHDPSDSASDSDDYNSVLEEKINLPLNESNLRNLPTKPKISSVIESDKKLYSNKNKYESAKTSSSSVAIAPVNYSSISHTYSEPSRKQPIPSLISSSDSPKFKLAMDQDKRLLRERIHVILKTGVVARVHDMNSNTSGRIHIVPIENFTLEIGNLQTTFKYSDEYIKTISKQFVETHPYGMLADPSDLYLLDEVVEVVSYARRGKDSNVLFSEYFSLGLLLDYSEYILFFFICLLIGLSMVTHRKMLPIHTVILGILLTMLAVVVCTKPFIVPAYAYVSQLLSDLKKDIVSAINYAVSYVSLLICLSLVGALIIFFLNSKLNDSAVVEVTSESITSFSYYLMFVFFALLLSLCCYRGYLVISNRLQKYFFRLNLCYIFAMYV